MDALLLLIKTVAILIMSLIIAIGIYTGGEDFEE